ncbi:Hypothetical protein NocV09_00402300 [Nannochloropsis oceanica]
MAKGRKAAKKRKTVPPPFPRDDEQDSSSSTISTTTKAKDKETQSFGILGSDGSSSDKVGVGFGATKPSSSVGSGKLSAMDVDAAFEKTMSKIKGQDRMSASPLGGVVVPGGPGQAPVRADGKVPVRNIGIFDVVPQSVQSGFELTLFALLTLNLLVIIVIGTGFAVEALPTSNLDLPDFLVKLSKLVQPFIQKTDALFTPALGVFFLLSSLLGSFKIAQLSQGKRDLTPPIGKKTKREERGRPTPEERKNLLT